MEKKKITKTNWYGSDVDENNKPVVPQIAPEDNHLEGLNEGELYIHNHPENPSIWIRTTDGKIVPISVDIEQLAKIFLRKDKDDRFPDERTYVPIRRQNSACHTPIGHSPQYRCLPQFPR